MHNPPLSVSVAPMMDWTDRHCRYFHRMISRSARLYTEMVSAQAILHGDLERLLGHDPAESPLALQLGGSDPGQLARAAAKATDFGFDEINLNCGCPSERVQEGRFGACLMSEPALVAECVAAMAESSPAPVSVKCRTGIDEQDSFAFLENFIDTVAAAGCKLFIVHARKAWLRGLSPKENREVPVLEHDKVYRLAAERPHLRFQINGGFRSVQGVLDCVGKVEGVMIGREAYRNPWILAELEERLGGAPSCAGREDAAMAMIPYAERMAAAFGTPIKSITRHMLGLFQGQKGARRWRQILTEMAHREGAGAEVIARALQEVHRRK